MCVIKAVIVNNGQSIRFVVFLHKIEWIVMVLTILNLEGHQNYMIISKTRSKDGKEKAGEAEKSKRVCNFLKNKLVF